jgi:exo-beta-1,3-glucanase (GH17 family)
MNSDQKCVRNGLWQEKSLAAAITDVQKNKMTLGKAAKKWEIPKSTLFDHIRGKSKHSGSKKITGRQPIFPAALEKQLVSYIQDFANNLFGLTPTDIRKFAYKIAEKNKIVHNFDRDTEMAGKKWFTNFMQRNRDLSILTPEKLSYARIQGFTPEAANSFYSVLEMVCVANGINATTIFNMDESGFGTVLNKAPKVVAKKGIRHLSTATSGERGVNTTVVACMSAAGFWVPPMVIFKGSRITPDYGIGHVPGRVKFFSIFAITYSVFILGGIIAGSDTSFINTELFIVWLEFFIRVVKPTKEKPVVLVLDGHTSHTKSIEALDIARDHGVILLQLPAHCTHRMQPLDVGFFYPLGRAYASEVSKWQAKNPGIPFTTRHFCGVFAKAYMAKASVQVATKAFETCGIWPVNRNVFDETEFARITNCNATMEEATAAASTSQIEQDYGIWTIDDNGGLKSVRQQVQLVKTAPTCTAISAASTSQIEPDNGIWTTDDDIGGLTSFRQQVQLVKTAQTCIATMEEATSAASTSQIEPDNGIWTTDDNVGDLTSVRQQVQLVKTAPTCTAISASSTSQIEPDNGIWTTDDDVGGLTSVRQQVQLVRTHPTCTATMEEATSAARSLQIDRKCGAWTTEDNVDGLIRVRQQVQLVRTAPTYTATMEGATAGTSNSDKKPILFAPLSEIMPIPVIRMKPIQASAAPVIELTAPIYICGLKEKMKIKEEKAKAKLEAQDARILAKKTREEKKEGERKAKEERKQIQNLEKEKEKKIKEEKKKHQIQVKEAKLMEAKRMKEERQREKEQKAGKKRPQESKLDGMEPKNKTKINKM